jgi:hypothetical protein
MSRALSSATALVLDALDRGFQHGFDILDATGLPSGTVYPILRRRTALVGEARARFPILSAAPARGRMRRA